MNYLQFRKQFYELGCVQVHQVYAWDERFDKSNLTRWVQKGLLLKLRNGYYSFPEYLQEPNFTFIVSNQIYHPSYVSLHTALAFYGMIPEAIVRTTAVSNLKKTSYENAFGTFTYQQIADSLMFGYDLKVFGNNRTVRFATPEKALLDLLYLYPFYSTTPELEELRLDEDFMHDDFDVERFCEYATRFQSKAFDKRVKLLIKTYEL
ncbi:MAG: hypothetical protein LBM61_04110 [Prevotellaceae bacterium]|jgi:predicted transcriptional regulator of viral defense system|nr:hypothetical protein [Prevotellaceae bacterium]